MVAVDVRDAGQDDFASSRKARLGVRGDRAEPDLEVGAHHLSVDANVRPASRRAHLDAVFVAVVVINTKPLEDPRTHLAPELDLAERTVGSERAHEADAIFDKAGFFSGGPM